MKTQNCSKLIVSLFCLGMVLLSTGCNSGSSGSDGSQESSALSFTPQVFIECDIDANPECGYTSQVQNCTGSLNQIHAVAVLTRNSCDNIESGYLAKGEEELLCSSFGCYGDVGRFKDENGDEIDIMPGGNANICVSIDINCDGIRNSGDLVFQTSLNIFDDLAPVEALSWTSLQ